MRIEKYGIVLNRLSEEDIELVRQMRNSDHIKKYMHYQDHIDAEMQKKWFDSVNNLDNFYFIIEKDKKKIGLIHGKKNDFTSDGLIAEAGIFVWDEEAYNTHVAVSCSIILADFTFYIMNIKETHAKVLKTNHKMLVYNGNMGYQNYDEDDEVVLQVLDQDSYSKSMEKVRHGLSIVTGDANRLSIEEISLTDDFKRMVLDQEESMNELELEHFSKIIQKAKKR